MSKTLPLRNSDEPRGLLYILLSAFAFSLGWFFLKSRTPTQDARESKYPQHTAKNKSHAVPDAAFFIGSNSTPTPLYADDAAKCRYPKEPRWKEPLELAAVLIALGLLVVNIFLWCATKKSADTAAKELELSDRPWIKETVSPAADLLADKGAFSWGITINIENAGHSVATNIYPRTELIAPKGADFIDGPRRRVIELCKDASQRAGNLKKDPLLWDTSVFPGDPVNSNQSPILFPKDEQAAIIDGGEKLGKSVPLMLVGCIAYDYPTASRFHETGFVYLLVHSDDASIPEPSRAFFSVEKTIPKDKLKMIKQGQVAN